MIRIPHRIQYLIDNTRLTPGQVFHRRHYSDHAKVYKRFGLDDNLKELVGILTVYKINYSIIKAVGGSSVGIRVDGYEYFSEDLKGE